MDDYAQMDDEQGHQNHGTEAVDGSHALKSTEHSGQPLRPRHVRKLKRHTGQGEAKEAQDEREMHLADKRIKALEQLAPVFGFLPFAPVEHFAERSRQPGQRMEPEEEERTDEQPGHAPERKEQQGVFFRVMVCGVGQIAREAPMASRVALRARGDNVVPADMGPRVRYGQDIVAAMAIIALGGGSLAELGNLPMIRFEIRRGHLSVAFSAGLENVLLE